MTTTTIIAIFAVALALVLAGGIPLAIFASHVTDTAEYEGEEDEYEHITYAHPLDAEWLDLAQRAGERAAIYIRVRQGIEARRGPGRHRAPEPAPSWVLNTQEIDRRWMQIVLHETAGAR